MKLESKKDFQDLMLTILNPLKPYYSEGKAELKLGETATCYDKKASYMEGFSRPLWGLVPFWAGKGEEEGFEEIYLQGLKNGTNPKHKEYWGDFHAFDQKFVEMAAIAYALILTPQKLWEPLKEEEKDNLAKWLYQINEYELPICNWILFAVLVNLALKKLGRDYDSEKLNVYLEGLETFYLGEGWYQDGDSAQKDYYVSFAIHFYCLFYAKVMEDEDPIRCKKYKERAVEFGQSFIYWFDDEGAALPYGRSLTYRFAQVSFWSACMMAEVYPFSLGVIKGLITRHLETWFSLPIFDRDHILTIGYGYPNLIMGERYNGAGSPYWSMKTFAILMLCDEHPFWKAESMPMPKLNQMQQLRKADMLIARYRGHTTAYPSGKYSPFGHGQTQAKYGKFAYDTRFGFSIAKSSFELHEAAPDSMLAFSIKGYIYVKRISESFEIKEDKVLINWSPYEGVKVQTMIIPTPKGHIRRHLIESEVECIAYDCGFAIPSEPTQEFIKSTIQNTAKAECRIGSCEVIGTYQEEEEKRLGVGEIIEADPNTNLISPKTVIPAICYVIREGRTVVETQIQLQRTN